MACGDPVEGILNEKPPYLITMWPIEVEGCPPRGLIALRKIRAKIAQIVSFGSKVVVHYIQHHSQATLMTGIDQPFEPFWPAIRGLRGKRIDAVVAPVTAARKLRDRHEFNRADPNVPEFVQVGDDGSERSFRGKRADVEFIEKVLLQGDAGPVLILPGEMEVHNLRGSVHVLGL